MKKNRLDTKFKNAKESLGFLIWKTSNKLQRLHRIGLKEFDLTPAQFSVLASIVYISSSVEVLTQSILCQHTQMDKMFISDIVKALVSKQLIGKKKNPIDSRAYLVRPTTDGVRIVNKAIKIIETMDQAFFLPIKNQSFFIDDLNRLLDE